MIQETRDLTKVTGKGHSQNGNGENQECGCTGAQRRNRTSGISPGGMYCVQILGEVPEEANELKVGTFGEENIGTGSRERQGVFLIISILVLFIYLFIIYIFC